MASVSGASTPPMSWEGIDHALNRVRGEADRISIDLADLDGHVGHRLLREADLLGRTRRRWERANAHIHNLWTVYGSFRRVVEEAQRLRESAEGGRHTQAALSAVLNGPAVPLPAEAGPVRAPDGASSGGELVTLAAAVARMLADYEEATEVVSAVETAWDALEPRLGELDVLWHEIGTLSDMVEFGADEHESLRAELDSVSATVRRDPLALLDDGRVDTSAPERLRLRLERVRGELRDALRMRDSYTESVERLSSAVDDVGKAVGRARALREQVVAKVSSPAATDVPDPVPELRARLDEMDALRAGGRWRELGALLGALQRAIHEAADGVRERDAALTGLLERRAELRGRLDAYRAHAVRLGLAANERLTELHRRAHWELWSAPCDLRAATVALSAYQRALQESGLAEDAVGATAACPAAACPASSNGEGDGGVSA